MPALNDTGRHALIEQRLSKRKAGLQANPRIPRRARPERAPLSTAQKRIWILHQFDPSSSVSNRSLAVRLSGPLDRSALEQAVSEIVRRHESLRTVFPDQDGEPWQTVVPAEPVRFDCIDLRTVPSESREAEARSVASQESHLTFDLARGPLLRAKVIQLDDRQHVLLVLMHHIVFDGWSQTVFLRELQELYSAFAEGQIPRLPEPPIQYSDFAVWQQWRLKEEGIARQIEYWRKQLDGIPSSLSLPADFTPPASKRGFAGQCSLQLPAELVEGLKSLSRTERVSLFMLLLAAYQLLLGQHADQDDIVVGVPIAGRTRVETEPLIGCFINVLVLRANLTANPTVREFLAQVRETALQAYANQEVPFERIVEELRPERHPDRWPLFQVMFQLRNLPKLDSSAADLRVEPFEFDAGVIGGLDLSLEAEEAADELHCSLRYDSGLFRRETAARMMQHFRNLLEAIVRDPSQRIWELPVLSEAERHRLLIEWNDTDAEFPENFCIHQLFERQAEKTPDALAVVFKDRQLTYHELNRRATQLAHRLRSLGAGPERLVGICIHRSPEMLVGLLGILKSGAAYVPLDPEYPPDRLAFLMWDAQTQILLTQKSLLESLPAKAARVLCLDTDWEDISRESDRGFESGVSPENLAYVIYTSGSTGKPKGVMIRHRSICNFVCWRGRFSPLGAGDRLLQRASFSFDDSVWEFFEPLSVGAALVMLRPGGQLDNSYLVDLMIRERVTAACFVPSMLRTLLEEPRISECTSLRRLSTGGEVLPVEVHDRVFSRLRAEFYNGYGPTEATVACTYFHCRRESASRSISIGRPVANTQIYIVGRHRQLVPIGTTGELWVGGVGVARGYLNRPELTDEKFVPDAYSARPGARLYRTGDLARYLPDGNIEFIGGADQQVKVRGFRIELGEIEEVLRTHPSIRDVAVKAREDRAGDKMLVAYFVPRPEQKPAASEFRQFLAKRLADYMVPSVFVELQAIPYLTSGKIDRPALPEPQQHDFDSYHAVFSPPRTSTERALAEIWSTVLELDRVGTEDNFFNLGGHSLSATRVMSRVRQTFSVELPLAVVLGSPNLAEMAAAIDSVRAHENGAPRERF